MACKKKNQHGKNNSRVFGSCHGDGRDLGPVSPLCQKGEGEGLGQDRGGRGFSGGGAALVPFLFVAVVYGCRRKAFVVEMGEYG